MRDLYLCLVLLVSAISLVLGLYSGFKAIYYRIKKDIIQMDHYESKVSFHFIVILLAIGSVFLPDLKKAVFPPTEYKVVCKNTTHTIGSYTYKKDIDFIVVDKPRLVSGGIIVAGIGGESFYEGVCSYWVLK